MTPRQRVWAALRGERTDRPPVSFWGHVYHRESSARELVDVTLERQHRYQWDWVKLNPRKHYHVEPWGVAYRYPGIPDQKPTLERWPIKAAADWETITEKPADQGALGEQIEAVTLLRRALPDVPIVATVFTPLAVLGEMTREPGELREHMRTHPERVRAALEAVTVTYERFAPRLIAAGADGLYFATTDWASRKLMSPEDYRAWARASDLRVLAAVSGAPFHVLHVCKGRNLLFELADYPVSAFSWDATDPTNPSLAEGLARIERAVMGGISQDAALLDHDPERSLGEYRHGLVQTCVSRWLVAPGCSIPPGTPDRNLAALAEAVQATRLDDPRSPDPAASREVSR
jgi:uroporphyrinogen decarboxylase